MKKRVLIVTYYWPPAGGSGVQRWLKFVKYLREFGWEPIVFTVKDGDYPILDEKLYKDVPANIEVIHSPIFEPYNIYKFLTGKKKTSKLDGNFLSQGKKYSWKDKIAVWIRGNFFIPDAKMFWIRPSINRLNEYLKNAHVDAIVSTGPPHSCHLIAYGAHKKYGTPWVVDYRDPWTQIDYFDDLGLTALARKRHTHLEKKVLNSCNLIINVGYRNAEDLSELTDNKRVVITNGYDDADLDTTKGTLDKEFSIVYIGTMNDSRNPIVLWQVLRELAHERHPIMDHVKVRIVGKPENVIKQSVDYSGLSDYVDFTGYVSHGQAVLYQNSARVLLLVINKTSNNKSILPGKIFEYMASERPILCLGPSDGDSARILKNCGHNSVFDYEDIEAVKEFILSKFLEYQNGDDSKIINRNFEKYSRRCLTEHLSEVLNELISDNAKIS